MIETAYIEAIWALWPRGVAARGQEALDLARRAIAEFPNSAKLCCMLGDLIQLVDEDRCDLSDALACYERAVELDPACSEAWESIGYYCDVMTDDFERAEEAFRRAVRLGGGEWSYRGLARVLALLGRDRGEVLRLLDECPHADSLDVQVLRDEIASGSWNPIKEA